MRTYLRRGLLLQVKLRRVHQHGIHEGNCSQAVMNSGNASSELRGLVQQGSYGAKTLVALTNFSSLKPLSRSTRLLFDYGKSAEGYFDTERFIQQQAQVLLLFESKFRTDMHGGISHRLCSTYDNSTVHRARGT